MTLHCSDLSDDGTDYVIVKTLFKSPQLGDIGSPILMDPPAAKRSPTKVQQI